MKRNHFFRLFCLGAVLLVFVLFSASRNVAAETAEKVTYVVVNGEDDAFAILDRQYDFSSGTVFSDPEKGEYLEFKNLRSATRWAAKYKTNGWGSDESLTILVDADLIEMKGIKSFYGAVTHKDGTILRADGTPLPITVKPYGERTSVELSFSGEGDAYFANHFIFQNIRFVSTGAMEIQCTATTEFYNCEFDFPLEETSTIGANGKKASFYGMMVGNADQSLRLDSNGEYTARVIFSGHTVVPETVDVYAVGKISATTADEFALTPFKNESVGNKTVLASQINGSVTVKDTAEIKGILIAKADSAVGNNSIQLGDAAVTVEDFGKVSNLIGTDTGVIGETAVFVVVKDNATVGSVVGMKDGSQGGTVTVTVEGGTVLGEAKESSGGFPNGKVTLNLLGGTYGGTVVDAVLGKAGEASTVILDGGTLDVKSVAGRTTVVQAREWGGYETVYVKAPAEFADEIAVENGNGVVSHPMILKNGYEVRGNVLPLCSLILEERIKLKAYFPKKAVETIGIENFTYCFAMDDVVLGEGLLSAEQLAVYGEEEYYWAILDAVGAGDFEHEIVYSVNGNKIIHTTLKVLAENGVKQYGEDTKEGILFRALWDYGMTASRDDGTLRYFKEEMIVTDDLPDGLGGRAEENASISFVGKTLLMGDSIGIRLIAANGASLNGAYLEINGKKMDDSTVTIDEKNGTMAFFVSSKNYNSPLKVKGYDAQGNLCLSLVDTVKSIAVELWQADRENVRAKATLAYIQAVQNFYAA